ncbi:MAG: LysR family transcriptional regulator [Rhodopila sp.]|nr:LysR family transcriptional regulator [Rhodopila sp.]
MDYFAGMRAFVRAVELGSFSRAAAEEGVKVSTVSRYVTALEADLGAALFNRSTRRLHLTEVGTTFYDRAVRIVAEVADARLAATSLNVRPQGLLRINIPGAFGRRHVVPHLRDFLAAYPDIQVDATLTDETVNLIASGADVAVRIGALADSTLVARRLAPQRRLLVAAPAYLADRRPVAVPSDLEDHDCLLFALQPKQVWYFLAHDPPTTEPLEVPVRGRLRANDSEALLDAVLASLGIALLPTWLTGEAIMAGRLTPLLPDWEALIAPGPQRAIWGVYPPKKVVSPKVRTFLSFIEARFGKPPYWDHAGNPPEAAATPGLSRPASTVATTEAAKQVLPGCAPR